MKKITLMLATAMAFSGIYAQDQRISGGKQSIPSPLISVKKNATPAIAAVVIFTEDFGSGIPGTWTITDNNASGEVWTSSMGPSGASILANDTLLSTTLSNGIAMVDDDLYGQGTQPNNTDLTTPAINCTGYSNIHISFFEYFKQYNNAIANLQISTDNVTWTTLYDPTIGLADNQSTPNPNLVDLNISSIADGQATVYIRFHYAGDWGYWWQIDDVQLYEGAAIDGSVTNIQSSASTCGLGTTEPVTATIFNIGSTPFSNFSVAFSVDGGTPVSENVASIINAGDSLVYTFTATADLSAPGMHSIDVTITVPSDGNASNDQTSFSILNSVGAISNGFELTDILTDWAIEDANSDGEIWGLADNPSFSVPAHTGNYCLRVSFPTSGTSIDDWIISSCVALTSGTNYVMDFWHHLFLSTGTETGNFEAYVGQTNTAAGLTQLISTAPGVLSQWTNSNATFSVPVSGNYYIGIRATNAGGTPGIMRIDDIDLSISSSISERSENKWFDVYPNPTNNNMTVRMNRPYDMASIEVINGLGAVITKTVINSELTNIDVSKLQSGIYTAKLTIDGREVNKRFTVTK